MPGSSTEAVERTLASPHLHRRWERTYHTEGNERFHDEAIDRLVDAVAPAPGAEALDAGCGPGLHSIRLARRGLRVTGADFAEPALELARRNVASAGVAERVELRREDLLDLSFADGRFDLVLCWGVLIHIPEVERAVAELCRVVRPGGTAILGEGNARSLDQVLGWPGRRRRGVATVRTRHGAEHWYDTEAGPMLAREADVSWLTGAIERNGLRVRPALAGEFTELYTRARPGSAIERGIHAFNRAWFRAGRSARFATGVFLIADRPAAPGA